MTTQRQFPAGPVCGTYEKACREFFIHILEDASEVSFSKWKDEFVKDNAQSEGEVIVLVERGPMDVLMNYLVPADFYKGLSPEKFYDFEREMFLAFHDLNEMFLKADPNRHLDWGKMHDDLLKIRKKYNIPKIHWQESSGARGYTKRLFVCPNPPSNLDPIPPDSQK